MLIGKIIFGDVLNLEGEYIDALLLKIEPYFEEVDNELIELTNSPQNIENYFLKGFVSSVCSILFTVFEIYLSFPRQFY